MTPLEPIRATVTRVSVSHLRGAQALFPVATVAAIVARRFHGVGTAALAGALLLACLGLLLSSRRRARRCAIHVTARTIDFDAALPALAIDQVDAWTVDDRRIRIYDPSSGSTFTASPTERQRLQRAIERVLPPPVKMVRRGSPRARWLAAVVGIAGLASIPVGVTLGIAPLVTGGVVVGILGFSALATYCQRVAATPIRLQPF